jgi:hypothetical protein
MASYERSRKRSGVWREMATGPKKVRAKGEATEKANRELRRRLEPKRIHM